MLKFLGKTLIVSAAVIAIPIVLMKRIKKLDEEGFFDRIVKDNNSNNLDLKKFPHINY